MMSALYIGASGLGSHTQGMNVLSNNIANGNTVGYKHQTAHFEDLISQTLIAGSTSGQLFNQRGLGVQLAAVRTDFSASAFEPGNAVTDLALSGKGFFQVTDGEVEHYTRAGNFRFDKDGFLKDPNQFVLSGIPAVDGVFTGTPEPIQIDFNDPAIAKTPPQATTEIDAPFNIASREDKSTSTTDPYFALASSWNGTQAPPLGSGQYAYSSAMRIYDAEGTAQDVTIYFDSAPSSGADKVVEYVVAMDPQLDGSGRAGTDSAGLLMSGTLTFASNGQLKDMSSFVPSGTDPKNLASWQLAPLSEEGVPQMMASFVSRDGAAVLAPQTIALNLGVSSENATWQAGAGGGLITSAADVGLNFGNVPVMGAPLNESWATTAFSGSSSTRNVIQDGHGIGDLTNVFITKDGTIEAQYSNGITENLYSIPIFRMTSEDGLRREGMNHFSAPTAAGVVEHGVAGTENYSEIQSNYLETSNTDMSVEMVNMIIMQRGFQSNSKSVTTADEMLQQAMDIKR